jgi:hypothetical protein
VFDVTADGEIWAAAKDSLLSDIVSLRQAKFWLSGR